MMKKSFVYKICVLLLMWSAVLGLNEVQAASLEITPTNNYLWVPGGSIGVVRYTLTNTSDEDMSIWINLHSFMPTVSGAPELKSAVEFPYLIRLETELEDDVINDVNDMGKLSRRYELREPFALSAKTSKEIWIGIESPLGVAEKEYPLNLVFETVADDNQLQEESSSLAGGVGSNLVVLVAQSNADQSQLRVQDLTVPVLVDSFWGLDLESTIINEGKTGTIINGKMELMQNDQVIEEWIFAKDLVLGESERQVRADSGLDRMARENLATKWRAGSFLIGPYTLKVTITSGHPLATTGMMEVSKDFFAFPYLILLGVAVIGVLIWIIKKLTAKKRHRGQIKHKASQTFSKLNKRAQAFGKDK